ncbi:MAG: hypothetical protein IT379_31025 [Deltaproteobacteria bacterium]|nr:hypothetical protein [Deltaproteobacteria bacterium]
MIRRNAFALFVFAMVPAMGACVRRTAAPAAPFGHPVAAMAAPAVESVRPTPLEGRTIVVGPIDSEVTQPIGGSYDREDYEHTPLARAWFVPEIATLLGDALVAAVRRRGGVGLRETSGVLLASARSLPLRQEGTEQWRVRIVSLQHDVVRDAQADQPYAELAARIVVERVAGGPTPGAPVERAFDVHLRLRPEEDALAALADAIIAEVGR